ncbi:MAG: polysaccharide deacetylase family protein [Erysipelotrichaceae bacterium]|nr:polysaccharide deacetylase family protein [Erysipelotrichaceae bacterium]
MFKRLYYILLQRLYVLKNKKRVCNGKVYMFHNVSDEDDIYTVSKDNFEKFIDKLSKTKKIVDFETLVNNPDSDNVVITFDDVYESVYRNAYPILKEKNIPYYLFICNEFLDKDSYIKTDEVVEMLKESKCIVGSHNYRHELSRFKDRNTVKEEFINSKKELEDKFGVKIDSMAFPFGSMYAVSEDNIEDAGNIYEYVCMTYPLSYSREDAKVLPRINMNSKEANKEL